MMTKPTSGDRSVIALTSAKQMRVLAHPLRLQILGELRISGPRTVGALCEVFDEAPGTLSYHLGKLAEFGFVEEAPGLARDRRERWWRSVHEVTNVSVADIDAPSAERRASAAVRHQIVDVYAATLHRVIDVEEERPQEWVEASASDDSFAFLTAAELSEASAELRGVAKKWSARGDRTREGTEAVQIIVQAFRRP